MYTLTQLHKLHTKEFLSFCITKEPPLKANLFLSFQTVTQRDGILDLFPSFPHKRALPTK